MKFFPRFRVWSAGFRVEWLNCYFGYNPERHTFFLIIKGVGRNIQLIGPPEEIRMSYWRDR